MKTYTVYYYVVGKTYTEGEVPHQMEVKIRTDIQIIDKIVQACVLAYSELKREYPDDTHTIVRVERKNYCYE